MANLEFYPSIGQHTRVVQVCHNISLVVLSVLGKVTHVGRLLEDVGEDVIPKGVVEVRQITDDVGRCHLVCSGVEEETGGVQVVLVEHVLCLDVVLGGGVVSDM